MSEIYRVVWSGSFFSRCRIVRCASRYGDDPDLLDRFQGFRPVLVSSSNDKQSKKGVKVQ